MNISGVAMKRPKNKFVKATAIVAAMILGTTACSGNAASQTEDSAGKPFSILAMVPTSGPLAKIGAGAASSLKAAVEVINAHKGIAGRQVEITFVDTTSSPSEAVSRLQSELSKEKLPDLVVPSVVSSETVALLPLLTQNEILSVGTAAGTISTDRVKFPYAFNTAVQAKDSMSAQIKKIAGDGVKKLGVIAPDSVLGRDKLKALEELTAKAGIEITSEFIDPASVDPTAELSRLKGSGVEALLVAAALGPSGAAIMGAFDKVGWDVPRYLDDAASTNNYTGLSPAALQNVTFAAMRYGVADEAIRTSDPYKLYWDAFTGVTTSYEQGPDVYVYPYSALILAKAAIDKAGGVDDLDAVVKSFENISSKDSELWIMTEDLALNPANHSIQIADDDMVFFPAGARNDDGLFTRAAVK
jgi:branched-chain amino acid transport system substrate-binding protein